MRRWGGVRISKEKQGSQCSWSMNKREEDRNSGQRRVWGPGEVRKVLQMVIRMWALPLTDMESRCRV